ncbi:transposase IS3/IS911 family protein [Citrobacter freundii ATCC 8090 = MTCC 1658 = NBRC 12681]|nr:transposase IS3/IS911 family protein [Citrobacter freundii ATCC 8090 = MTCC 1658 = NBRC 12681]GAL42481.1 putative transposase [Citrobacter freundii ATCC 8090 = MTCC 1658 = NBRC 12681]VDZ59102.1 ISEc14 transposase A [Citrobacter freundii]
MSSKRYPEEFKIEAVKQVVDRGHSVSGVATRLDITTHSLYAWIKKYGPDSSTNTCCWPVRLLCRVLNVHPSGVLHLASAAAFTTASGGSQTDRTNQTVLAGVRLRLWLSQNPSRPAR